MDISVTIVRGVDAHSCDKQLLDQAYEDGHIRTHHGTIANDDGSESHYWLVVNRKEERDNEQIDQ